MFKDKCDSIEAIPIRYACSKISFTDGPANTVAGTGNNGENKRYAKVTLAWSGRSRNLSRLSRQIEVSRELNGLAVHPPDSQY